MADHFTLLADNRDRYVAELRDFVRIPSISSLPDHQNDVRHAAAWIRDRLTQAGLEHAEILETGAQPAVYADHLHVPGAPTVLIYAHFDVQPAVRSDGWNADPFDPVLTEDRVYGRGSSDDKGNLLIPVQAIEALLADGGALPVNVKFLLEGQEEIGSPTMQPFVAENALRLACDLAVSADGSQWSPTEPGLWLSLRGLCSLQINVTGPAQDVHSGTYGGAIHNPIHALVRILDSMRDKDGKILVEDFFKGVPELTDTDRAALARIPFDQRQFLNNVGSPGLFGEPGYDTRARQWRRPTLEINGIWGGFQGEGVKTVLPSQAHAKITCRLVGDQDPDQVRASIADHVRRHAGQEVSVEVVSLGSSGLPYTISIDHPGNQAARAVLSELYGTEPYAIASGGSIPILGMLQQYLGAKTVIFAFALDDEGAHGPDEFFRLASYERGRVAYCRLLQHLVGMAA